MPRCHPVYSTTRCAQYAKRGVVMPSSLGTGMDTLAHMQRVTACLSSFRACEGPGSVAFIVCK
eukprot:7621863-Alexandrium_andersonii.AAC.1